MCPSKSSSPRHCARNSIGPSNRWRKIGSSEKQLCALRRFQEREFDDCKGRNIAWHGLDYVRVLSFPSLAWDDGGQ